MRINNQASAQEEAKALRSQLPKSQQFRMDQASDKGASSWLTALPIQEFGFCHHKQAIREAFIVCLICMFIKGFQPVATGCDASLQMMFCLQPRCTKARKLPSL